MKKVIMILVSLHLLCSCANYKKTIDLNHVLRNLKKYDNKIITLKGFLKFSVLGNELLYLSPGQGEFIDLFVEKEKMINVVDLNTEKEFYCVMVKGKFKQYTSQYVAIGSLSDYGVILAEVVEPCG